MHSEILVYEADGLTMHGQLFHDPSVSEQQPGVLVFPEAFGLGEHAMGRAERLARLGFVALASDLHGERKVHDDFPTIIGLLEGLKGDPQRVRSRASGALAALRSRPEVDPGRIFAIGYCFGGTMALEMARAGEPIAGAVCFHSGLTPIGVQAAPAIAAKLLVCVGADDPSIDQAQRNAFEQEMRAAKADWQMHVYGGVVHSFTSPDADARGAPDFARYDAHADSRSWAAMLAFFEEILGPQPNWR